MFSFTGIPVLLSLKTVDYQCMRKLDFSINFPLIGKEMLHSAKATFHILYKIGLKWIKSNKNELNIFIFLYWKFPTGIGHVVPFIFST